MSLSYWENGCRRLENPQAEHWRVCADAVSRNLIVLGVLPELTRTDPSYWALAVPLLTALVLSLFVLLPLVVRGLIKGPLGTFRLVVKRDEPCRSTL